MDADTIRRLEEAQRRYMEKEREAALDKKRIKSQQESGIRKKKEMNGEVWVDGFVLSRESGRQKK